MCVKQFFKYVESFICNFHVWRQLEECSKSVCPALKKFRGPNRLLSVLGTTNEQIIIIIIIKQVFIYAN